MVEVWKRTSTGAQQDTATNLNNYYNAFSKPLTLQTSKGPRREIFFVGNYFSAPPFCLFPQFFCVEIDEQVTLGGILNGMLVC